MPRSVSQFSPNHARLVGIDSDGCVFDSMEIKHKECFCPRFIQYFSLQPVSRAARECWEFVNLYSISRGSNRFRTLLRSLDLLANRPVVAERAVSVPRLPVLREWISTSGALSTEALRYHTERFPTGSPQREELELVLRWSDAVNATVREIVTGLPPFPGVRESLAALADHADLVVISQTPEETLLREWEEHDLARYVAVIAGQEQGSKTEHLQIYAGKSRYTDGEIVMIGDAPGDYDAALAVGARFFPVIPGAEAESWRRFNTEAIPMLLDGGWDKSYTTELFADFSRALPEEPLWEKS